MIVDERMRTYINSLDMGNTPFLEELEQYAIRERVPIIRRDMQSFMRMLLALKQPKRILEVGTAIGFSTLLMCEYGPEDLEIVTIENMRRESPSQKRISGKPDGKRRLLCWRETQDRSSGSWNLVLT